MRLLRILTTVNDKLSSVAKILMAAILLFFLGVLTVNVITRYLFSFSFSWVEELTSLAIIWIVFLGGGIISREGGHLSIEAVAERLPASAQLVLKTVIGIVTVVVSLFLMKLSINQVALLYQYGQITAAAKLPVYIAYLVMPLGFLLIALGFLEYTLKDLLEK